MPSFQLVVGDASFIVSVSEVLPDDPFLSAGTNVKRYVFLCNLLILCKL